MTTFQRTCTYLGVLTAVIVVTWMLLPKQIYVPQGVLLPSGNNVPPVDVTTVKLVRQEMAEKGIAVGYVNVETYAPTVTPAAITATETSAKLLAANAGANQLIIIQFGQSPAEKIILLQAQAVRVFSEP